MRHWKQRYSPDARLVFRKRMQLGACGVDMVHPGDEVTQEMKETFGRHRLRIWWEGGFLEIQEVEEIETDPAGTPGEEVNEDDLTQEEIDDAQPATNLEHVGAGWYDVTLQDGTVERVRGKVSAQLLLDSQSQDEE